MKKTTTIIIDTGNTILNPDDLEAPRFGQISWLIYNHDNVPHNVVIEPGSFVIKGSNTKENPLDPAGLTLDANVPSNQFGLLKAKIKSNAIYAKYKYSIKSDGKALDPDLDVVDP